MISEFSVKAILPPPSPGRPSDPQALAATSTAVRTQTRESVRVFDQPNALPLRGIATCGLRVNLRRRGRANKIFCDKARVVAATQSAAATCARKEPLPEPAP